VVQGIANMEHKINRKKVIFSLTLPYPIWYN